MQKALLGYLAITGVLGTLSVLMPALVILAGIALIVPGLVLAVMPTAFFWGLIFAAVWWPARWIIDQWAAAALGVAVVAVVVTEVPKRSNEPVLARIETLRAGDSEASSRIALEGAIRLEVNDWAEAQQDDPEWKAQLAAFNAAKTRIDWSKRPLVCDTLCLSILFTPGVASVTVSPQPRTGEKRTTFPAPATFTLDRTPGCTGSLDIGTQSGGSLGFKDLAAMQDNWRVQIAAGNCIRRGPDSGHPNLTIANTQWQDSAGTGDTWSLKGRPFRINRLDIKGPDGAILMRRTGVSTTLLSWLLWMEPIGGMSDFHFDWALDRAYDERAFGAFTPAGLLTAVTSLATVPDKPDLSRSVLESLVSALDDPQRPASDPAFDLVDRVFDDLGSKPADADTAALVIRIINDPRAHGFGRIWQVVRKIGPASAPLREPIIRRVLAATYPKDRESGVRSLGMVLAELPPGTFATPSDDETRLLADPGLRNWAVGLIRRQADRGSAAVPLLVQILSEGWKQPVPRNGSRELEAANASAYALCALGPAAASALPEIEALFASGTIPARNLDDRGWQVTLARLGRPLETFYSAPNSSWSDAQLRNWIRDRLAKFDPRRDCH